MSTCLWVVDCSCPHVRGRAKWEQVLMSFLQREVIPLMRARPRDLITYKNPPPSTITLGLGVQHMNFGRHGHSVHCIICWTSAECTLSHLALTATLKGRNHPQFMCSKTPNDHLATEQQCQDWGWSRLFPSYCATAFQPSVSSRQSGLHRHFPGLDTGI